MNVPWEWVEWLDDIECPSTYSTCNLFNTKEEVKTLSLSLSLHSPTHQLEEIGREWCVAHLHGNVWTLLMHHSMLSSNPIHANLLFQKLCLTLPICLILNQFFFFFFFVKNDINYLLKYFFQ